MIDDGPQRWWLDLGTERVEFHVRTGRTYLETFFSPSDHLKEMCDNALNDWKTSTMRSIPLYMDSKAFQLTSQQIPAEFVGEK